MSRPLRQGDVALAQDVALLARMLKRQQEDPKRVEDDHHKELVKCLKRAIVLLTSGIQRLKKPRAA